jgi:uncharacterized protein (TIGR04255 family)
MSDRPPDLPDFGAPPVVEVVLSVQFEPLQNLRVVHLGQLWSAYRERFPIVEEHAPLPRVHETFGGAPQPTMRVAMHLLQKPDLPRVWFKNVPGTELVQFQADRFVRNWRKYETDVPYPRYEGIRDSFFEGLSQLREFAAEHKLGAINPDQCEVTYVNHIASQSGENLCQYAHRVLTGVAEQRSPAPGLHPENSRISLRYVMVDSDDTPIGRLTVTADPVWTADEVPTIVLTLTARGKPSDGSDGVADFFNRGRETIVHAFASLTTPAMHDRWLRRQ